MSVVAALVVLAVPIVETAVWASDQREVHALKVAGPDGGVSLLIGSMHVGNRDLVQPSEAILDGANRLIVESLPTDKPPGESLPAMLDPAVLVALQRTGQITRAPWSNGLTADQLAVMREHLQCISPGDNADTTLGFMLASRPMYAAIAAGLPCSETGTESRDNIIQQEATSRNLTVVPLETAMETSQQLEGVSDQAYIDMIHTELSPVYRQAIDQLISAMNKGDWDEVARIEATTGNNVGGPNSWHERMMVERNAMWMPRLLEALKGGGAVVLVGAGHIGGPWGLVATLRNNRFEVTPTTVPAQPD